MKKKELEAIIKHQNSRIETLERLTKFVLMYGKDGARITVEYRSCCFTYIIEYISKYDMVIKTYNAGCFLIELKEICEDYIVYSKLGRYYKLSKVTNEAVDITEFYSPMVKAETTAEPNKEKRKCKKGGKK